MESDLQPDPPAHTLVENEGVDAGELGDGEPRPGAAAARAGGRPEQAEAQVEETEQAADDELAGAPSTAAEERDAGGQDSGSID